MKKEREEKLHPITQAIIKAAEEKKTNEEIRAIDGIVNALDNQVLTWIDYAAKRFAEHHARING